MTKVELELLNNITNGNEVPISILDLEPSINNKTLLYGYTCDRNTFHVYIKNKQIHAVTYITDYSQEVQKPKNMQEITIKSNEDYVPDKRLYPERCDYKFCELLKQKNIYLPFTVWNNDVEKKDFYGFTLEDN